MKIYSLSAGQKIVDSRHPFGIGEEIVVENFYMLASGVELHRLHRVDSTFFIMYQTERAVTDTSSRKELYGEIILRI